MPAVSDQQEGRHSPFPSPLILRQDRQFVKATESREPGFSVAGVRRFYSRAVTFTCHEP